MSDRIIGNKYREDRRLLANGLIFLIVGFLAMLSGCTSPRQGVTLPPVTASPTGTPMVGKFVWFDLITDDVPTAKRFYSELLGWTFQGNENVYTVISNRGVPIGGVVYKAQGDPQVREVRWIGSLSVTDVDQAVSLVRRRGGTVYGEPEELPNRGRLAVISDPEGAVVALLRASGGDPADVKPRVGDWLWVELWSLDPSKAKSFYGSLVGYEDQAIDIGIGQPYHVFRRDGVARAGLVEIPWKNVQPQWLPSVLVTDPEFIASRVEALGGEVILSPDDKLSDGSVAIIADPSGAVFVVERWPHDLQTRLALCGCA